MILILSSIVSSRNRKLKFATCQSNLIKIFHDSRIQNGELVDLITVSHDFLQKKGTLEQASRMKYTLHKDRSHSPHFLNILHTWDLTTIKKMVSVKDSGHVLQLQFYAILSTIPSSHLHSSRVARSWNSQSSAQPAFSFRI